MHSNYKLKYAVTATLSVLAIGFQSSSHALGLSDIQVQSRLGEPLKANVNVLGAADLKSPSCLRLGPNSDLSNINFKLGQISGGNASLTLTSNKVINEPIVNLSVVAGCNNSITRDYVLLLDPPFSLQSLDTTTHAIDDVVIVQKTDTAANSSTVETILPSQKIAVKAQKKKRNSKKAVAKKRKKAKTTATKAIGITRANSQSTGEKKAVTSQSRLSISNGNNTTYTNITTTGLRLDKQLRFKPSSNTAISNESIAVEDEITVMNNRLAHLQAQITTLQKQNTKLTSDNKLKSEQLKANSSQTNLTSVLPFLGAGLLLLGGYTGFHWLRRRQKQLQSHHANAIWMNAANSEAESSSTQNELETLKEEDIFSDVDFGINNAMEEGVPSSTSMESIFESTKMEQPIVLEVDEQQLSILDHADVFLSHGRVALAIQLLQNHLLEHPKQSVTIWLFLLDLLAKENLKTVYEEATLECKLHFNIKVAPFSDQEPATSEPLSLEDFPRLAQGLEDVWNTPAATVYLDDLIYNNRLEPRAGLSKSLIEELVLLKSIAQSSTNSADVIQLDEKKLAIIEQKEALLESKKAEKLRKMVDDQKLSQEKAEAKSEPDADDTTFEFTLVER